MICFSSIKSYSLTTWQTEFISLPISSVVLSGGCDKGGLIVRNGKKNEKKPLSEAS